MTASRDFLRDSIQQGMRQAQEEGARIRHPLTSGYVLVCETHPDGYEGNVELTLGLTSLAHKSWGGSKPDGASDTATMWQAAFAQILTDAFVTSLPTLPEPEPSGAQDQGIPPWA